EKLLTDVYGQLFSISSPFFTLSYTQFYGNALLASVYNLIFNPSLVIGIPPNFYIELSLYAVIMGLIVATLVSSTILRVKNLFGAPKENEGGPPGSPLRSVRSRELLHFVTFTN
ncbi:MAG: hypothetical protein QXZ65_04635, partial [Metallosphaera sp.]